MRARKGKVMRRPRPRRTPVNVGREPPASQQATQQAAQLAVQVAELTAVMTRQSARIDRVAADMTGGRDPRDTKDVAALRAENQKLTALNEQLKLERDRLWQSLSSSLSNTQKLLEAPKPARARRWWQFWQEDGAGRPEDEKSRPAGYQQAVPDATRDYGDLNELIDGLSQVMRTLENMGLQSIFLANDEDGTELIEQAAGLCRQAAGRFEEFARRGLGVTILTR